MASALNSSPMPWAPVSVRRAAALKANASRDKALEIDLALARLTESGAQGMGELFKALAIADPKLGALPGFATT